VTAKALLLAGVGAAFAVLGWAAWTGRYRAWARRGMGYRVLCGLPFGAGLFFLGLAVVLPVKVGAVFFVLSALCNVVGFLYLVATVFVKDKWYPRWYHELPPDERRW